MELKARQSVDKKLFVNVTSCEMLKCQNCVELWLSLVNQVKSLQTKKLISKRGESGFHPATVTSRGTTTDQLKDKDKDKNKDNKLILKGEKMGPKL